MRTLAWLSSLVFFACLDPTQATLDISTNAPCGGEPAEPGTLYESGVLAGNAERAKTGDLNTTTTACDSGAIGTIVLFPSGGATEATAVVVGALGSRTAQECLELSQGRREGDLSDCIIARRVVTFAGERDLRVPILLDNACVGVACEEGTTCVRGEGGVPKCVSATVDCNEDGSCIEPAQGSTTGQGGMTGQGGTGGGTGPGGNGQGGSGQGGNGQGGTAGAGGGTGGGGGGITVPLINATLVDVPVSLTTVKQVSGDSTGPLVGGIPADVYRPTDNTPLLTYARSEIVEIVGATQNHDVVFSSGAAAIGSDVLTPASIPDEVVDIYPESATDALAVTRATTPTIARISTMPAPAITKAVDNPSFTGNTLQALYGDVPTFAVGDAVCVWGGQASDLLNCELPASGPLEDVWSEGSLAYGIGGDTFVVITSGLLQTPTVLPLDPSLTPVVLSTVFGSFTVAEVWVGGKTGNAGTAYLARFDPFALKWDEFYSPTLMGIEDLWLQTSTKDVYFVSNGQLYVFSPPPMQ